MSRQNQAPDNALSRETLCCGQYLRLIRSEHWEYVERVNAYAVVVIMGATSDNKIVLVEQHRIPVNSTVIELPAGLVGDTDAGEEILDAARREFLEETGYAAQEMSIQFRGPVTAGLSNEEMVFCLADGLEKRGPGGGDHTEDIQVHEVPLDAATSWLQQMSSRAIIDPKIYAALYVLAKGP